MKRLIIWFTILTFFSSVSAQEKSEAFYRTLLAGYKEFTIDSYQAKKYMIAELESQLEEISSDALINEYNVYIDQLNAIHFYRFPAKPLSEIPPSFLREFDVKEDKFRKLMFVSPKTSQITGDCIEPYLVLDDKGHVSMRTRINYYGKQWVFMNRIQLLIDEDVLTYEFQNAPTRDILGGDSILEKVDESVEEELYAVLAELVEHNKRVTIRFDGDRYTDQNISKRTIQKVASTLDLFDMIILE